jgi:peptide/nickel transport system permease protein
MQPALELAEAAAPALTEPVGAKRRRPPIVAAVIFAVVLVLVVFGGLIAPHAATQGSLTQALRPPVWSHGGSWSYPLGTDQLGRDLLSRLIIGARTTVLVAFSSVAISAIVGCALGLIGGYFGGLVDEIIMRLADAALAIPLLVLGLALATIRGPGTLNVVLAVVALTWAFFARVVRAEVLRIRVADYVTAARLMGLSRARILVRHVLPNVLNTIIVICTLQAGNVLIVASGLSFLGLGVPEPAPEWGLLLSDSQDYIGTAPWLAIAPAVCLAAFVLSVNTLGDWLRDRLDPRGRA